MTLSEKIAAQMGRLPASLKTLLDAELANGNTIIEVEKGVGEREGQIILVLERPLRESSPPSTPSVQYRETQASDRRIFEFVTDDALFALVHVAFKSVVLEPITGPPPPPAPKAPPAKSVPVSPTPPPVVVAPVSEKATGPVERFLASMTMTFDMWHDGTGYDLEALSAVPADELPAVEARLIAHRPRDWRDIEALAVIDSPRAKKTIREALDDGDPNVRREAARHCERPADTAKREALLVEALNKEVFFGGLSAALEEAEEFHPPAVIDALLRGALHRDGEAAVHFAALLHFLYGRSKEAFDWEHRPFFLRFHTTDNAAREVVFRELCETINVDPERYCNMVSKT